ncbi:MAG: hypothetical protein A2937_02485 [Candidatus Yonathbacteria bacterium RIFCSPLOWO2_01_FULL_47_33b]|uniref:Uncharacterized protein n=1 Tax=Candidatus Yonathbacteria bacterium RIFCSPLOWO2_01_FULL_47_33b TaxID=1802727 RepID=A0A1G2SG40_9BACT|nr:MAG: hypothetical protein A2937_02485 [Candidatus Yonathbacteria bacterium RIFCSPLOWO2_01_FULL_47_33b]
MSTLLKSIARARKEYCKTKPGSEEQRIAFENWSKLSFEEIKGAATVSEAYAAYIHAPFRGDALDAARDKWNELSLKEAEEADTIEKAEAARMSAPNGSEAKRVALEKTYQLAVGVIERHLSNPQGVI